jgi:sporulation protein YlmC with PRC-barrel domain
MPVTLDDTREILGTITGIVLNPDTPRIEGFVVQVQHVLSSQHLFLSWMDILRFGTKATVRDPDALCPPEDIVRLRELLGGKRTVLGQKIRTESGLSLGRCKDVQFDTAEFLLTWLFPKKFVRWGTPLAVTNILEVRPDAIIVRDQTAPAEEEKQAVASSLIPQMPETA